MKKVSNYIIGLSLGLYDVGYSVCDINGKLIRFKHRNMWGISRKRQTFTAAMTSPTIWIQRLQELFSSEISSLDPDFFERIGQGLNGKDHAMSFVSDVVTERKELTRRYPTIYHLRNCLTQETGKVDLRLLYLALHHILKRVSHPREGMRIYEKHKRDLALLKQLYRKYAPQKYASMFRRSDIGPDYAGYIVRPPLYTQESFYARIRQGLGDIRSDSELLFCFSEMENGTFLPHMGEDVYYEPPSAEEVAQILENQAQRYPFLARQKESIKSLCEDRCTKWLLVHQKETIVLAHRMVQEIVKIQGTEPDQIFITWDLESELDRSELQMAWKRIHGACQCAVAWIHPEDLEKVEKTAVLLDSRLINDNYPAQRAFLALSLGLFSSPSACDGEAEPDLQKRNGRLKIDVAAFSSHRELISEIKRTFGFFDFFESGFPGVFCRYHSVNRMRSPQIGLVCRGNSNFALGEQILYNGVEYGIAASGELVSLTQITLPQPILERLNNILSSDGQECLYAKDYIEIYEVLLEKAEKFSLFYQHSTIFSDNLRQWFYHLSIQEQRQSIISLLHGLRAVRSCGIFVEHLDYEHMIRVDRSVTGMFEQKRKYLLCAT